MSRECGILFTAQKVPRSTFYAHLLQSFQNHGIIAPEPRKFSLHSVKGGSGMILMIDNYDSFTYNLVQYLTEMAEAVQTFRNDDLSLSDIYKLSPKMLVISPGPCTPNEAGITLAVIREFCGKIPLLGVCLGHQAIGQIFGAKVIRAQKPIHGKTSLITHDGKTIFRGLQNPLSVCRYHSLIIDPATIPSCLEVSAQTADGEIMGIRHRHHLVEGVQFHPEAILTEGGKKLLQNFILLAKSVDAKKPGDNHEQGQQTYH